MAENTNKDERAKFRIRELETYYGTTRWITEVQEQADPTKKWKLLGKESWHTSKEDALKQISNYKSNVLQVKSEKIHEVK